MSDDRVTPQSVEMEQTLLGALLLESWAIDVVLPILPAEAFYKPAHGTIYRHILLLKGRGESADILSVTKALLKSGDLDAVGGASYVTALTGRVANAAAAEFHARIIAQDFLAREIIQTCSQTISRAYYDRGDVFELYDRHMAELQKTLSMILKGRQALSIPALIKKETELYDARSAASTGKKIIGVPSGFYDLDKLTGGWQDSDLVILAARPSMGKTALMLCFAINAAAQGVPVKIFSLETSAIKLVQRMLLILSEVDSQKYKAGTLSGQEINTLDTARLTLREMGIEIDDTSGVKPSYISSEVRKWRKKHDGKALVLIDYLGFIRAEETRGITKNDQVGSITASLKGIAKDNDLPVICLSQLSRAVETRGGDKRPTLSDLRDSGSIEQDADVVMFIYRPEYYGFEQDDQGQSTKGVAEIIIDKHRDGECTTVELKFIDTLTKFLDRNDSRQVEEPSALRPNIDFTRPRHEQDINPF